jgi:transaldolase/glucose-6-phosphate isomerase
MRNAASNVARPELRGSGAESPLLRLIEHGQSYWLDNLSRAMIRDGELERRVAREGLRGITSNPKIFDGAISKGEDYDEQIRDLVARERSIAEIYDALTVADVRDACDVLRRVYDGSDGSDGFVSLEVSPYLAHDAEASLAEARRLFSAVDRPNLFIKIPGAPVAVPAIEEALFQGINVNITLLFSIESYEAVARAYVRALERRAAAGRPIDRVASVASFFLSRIDVLVDELLGHRIRPDARPATRPELLLGKAAVANAKLAYQSFKRIFSGDRWTALRSKGARVQRVLWASTSTKDPLYGDVRYVEPLIGPDTVNTMPAKTIAAFGDHGVVADTLEQGVEESRRVMDDLRAAGIDLERVTWQLLNEGVRKFIDPYDDLMSTLAEKRCRFLGAHAARQSIAPGAVESDVSSALESFATRRFGARLFARDPGLWASRPRDAETTRSGLAWLALEECGAAAKEIRAFAKEARSGALRHVVLLGTGGGVCAAVCREILASAGGAELTAIDETDPGAIRAVEHGDPAKAVFVVGSATAEKPRLYQHFWSRLEEAGVAAPERHFVAVAGPGTRLADEARKRRFLRCFETALDGAGPYGALAPSGLVAMALVGIDIEALLGAALQMRIGCGPEVPAAANPALHLGALLGMAARAGRDKVTLAFSEALQPFARWLEPLLAASASIDGPGLLPVGGEALGSPDAYREDRVFVSLRLEEERDQRRAEALAALEEAGHPVVRIELADRLGIGGEIFRWQLAAATAAAVLGANPFG